MLKTRMHSGGGPPRYNSDLGLDAIFCLVTAQAVSAQCVKDINSLFLKAHTRVTGRTTMHCNGRRAKVLASRKSSEWLGGKIYNTEKGRHREHRSIKICYQLSEC